MENKRQLILASNSPRRKEILEKANLDFTIIKSNYDEKRHKFYSDDIIKKNSLYKALDVAIRVSNTATVIGSDTMVILNSVCLLKPVCKKEALFMLKNLSGKTHSVMTSISLVDSITKKELTEVCETKVTFRNLTEQEIEDYIEKFNPMDKAGSYGIQDFITPEQVENPPKESFVTKIEGDYYNVMGICISKLLDMLKQFDNN